MENKDCDFCEYFEAMAKDTTPAGLNCIQRASDKLEGWDWWETDDFKHFFKKADETLQEMKKNNHLKWAETGSETDHNEFIARITTDLLLRQEIQIKWDTGIIEIMGECFKRDSKEKEAIINAQKDIYSKNITKIRQQKDTIEELEAKVKDLEEALGSNTVNGPFKVGDYHCTRTGRPVSIIKKNPASQVVKFSRGFGMLNPTYRKIKIEEGKAYVKGITNNVLDRIYWQDLALVEG